MDATAGLTRLQLAERAALYRRADPAFAEWASGSGVVEHRDDTQVRVHDLVQLLRLRGGVEPARAWAMLAAADRIANAAMWLVVHLTYARRVHRDGRNLAPEDFKPDPQGHTGGALNMVPAYVGYLLADALTATTRAWIMGQGHCVAAIDAVNLLLGNLSEEHAARYDLGDEGLTRFVDDFYAYAVRPDGRPASPLGSHVNPHTAGGSIEGGYLGFAELQYVHLPLPGESLVAFLSDGAFEEQRGGDWAPRWWRAEDCGLVMPIMIANGRRIDQRTSLAGTGGVRWFREHLRLNGFDPVDLDGRDPAAFAWAVVAMEERLRAAGRAVAAGQAAYPVPLPHGIAETEKGYGFPGAGTNRAHNLPLDGNPHRDAQARAAFNDGARRLWVPPAELQAAIAALRVHREQGRALERDHPLANRACVLPRLPEVPWREPGSAPASPMQAIDEAFAGIVRANPQLRPRVGNPDEMRSNRLDGTLDQLRHRVTAPEKGIAEAVHGAVITALNEEAVVGAVLANKGGIGLVHSYEAFAVKMLGSLRQELIWARHAAGIGRPARWISVPVICTSHTWENGKNEQSHQDPTLAEAMLGEMADVSRVCFPADWNSALATIQAVYADRGRIWTLVVPKNPQPARFDREQARRLVADGGLRLRGRDGDALALIAVGAYQLTAALRASRRLDERGVGHALVYLAEPGRFREPRDEREATAAADPATLVPASAQARVLLCHTRGEPLLGALRPLDTGPGRTLALGYRNRGGTLDVPGMLFANRCTWAHALAAAAQALGADPAALLGPDELAAVRGDGDPQAIIGQPD